jgi:hypothetical protein
MGAAVLDGWVVEGDKAEDSGTRKPLLPEAAACWLRTDRD